MSSRFHLAILAGDLDQAVEFYRDILGCTTGNSETGKWVDINLWGNELTLHQSNSGKAYRERHHVDMADVDVPHFGVHLEEEEFQALKGRVEAAKIPYREAPYRRFDGSEFEQETFFIEDPNGNVLEIKTMVNPDVLFDDNSAAMQQFCSIEKMRQQQAAQAKADAA